MPATGADIVDRSFGFMVQDFAFATEPVDNVVTDPPFALARQFVDHALELTRRRIAILFSIARLNAARWLEDTPFRQLWLLTPRPSMPPGEVILRGEKPGGGKTDFAWLVFEQAIQVSRQSGGCGERSNRDRLISRPRPNQLKVNLRPWFSPQR